MSLKLNKVSIGLSNPKSPTNVGAVMRAAGCFNASEVFYTGKRYARAARFHTDTKNNSRHIPLTAVESLLSCAPNNAKIICVELVEGATCLPDYIHPENAYYIFGPEDGSLRQDIINAADAVVYIPTVGCLNLAATVNVLLYDRAAKSSVPAAGDQLIRKSRDVNNKLSKKTK